MTTPNSPNAPNSPNGGPHRITRASAHDETIPLADLTLTCAACGRSFTPISGETVCPACIHVASADVAEAANEAAGDDNECPSCSYSLRGIPAGSRCPECGWNPRTGRVASISLPPTPAKSSSTSAAVPVELPRGAARRRLERPADDLLTRGPAASAALTGLVLCATLCGVGTGVLALQHWWSSFLGSWSVVSGWGLMTVAAVLLSLPGSLPARRISRWWSAVAIFGGALAAAALAAYPLTAGVGGIALQALWDFLTILGSLAFIIALVGRLNAIVEFTGQDPSDRGFLSSSGPVLAGIFIVAMGFLLTWFFRRKLDFADAFSLAVAVWLVWRLTAILWHAKNAVRTRSDRAARERRRAARGPSGAGSDAPAPLCAKCGYTLRGVSMHARCPECGGFERE